MYFGTKSYLKSNRNHTAKYTLNKDKNGVEPTLPTAINL
jgi:hypothetical protein